jgi:hypothetical protein
MNDPFEEKLRMLKPGTLPAAVRMRLADPPTGFGKPNHWLYPSFGALLAAAASIALVLHFKTGPAPTPGSVGNVPLLAQSTEQRVTSVRPLSVFTDQTNRKWKLMEVSWIEEDTMVSTTHPVAVQTRNQYRTIVPSEIQFD